MEHGTGENNRRTRRESPLKARRHARRIMSAVLLAAVLLISSVGAFAAEDGEPSYTDGIPEEETVSSDAAVCEDADIVTDTDATGQVADDTSSDAVSADTLSGDEVSDSAVSDTLSDDHATVEESGAEGASTPTFYRIEYVLGGPEGDAWDAVTNPAENPVSYNGLSVVKFKKPVRKGYTFGGWYRDSRFKKKITKLPKRSKGDRTLYAKWIVNRYTVSFKGNGGKGKMKSLRGYASKDLAIPECRFSYRGHTFRGWSLTPVAYSDDCIYPTGVIPAGSITGKKQKVTFYAQWDNEGAGEYYVSVSGNDGNDGSKAAPYRTIQHALDQAAAGSVINVAAGTYDEMLTAVKNGEPSDPIVIRGVTPARGEEEEWHLTCPTKLTYTGNDENITLIDIDGFDNIRIENLDIGDIETKYACGIYLPTGSRNIVIQDCRIHDIKVASPYLVSAEDDEEAAGEANAILCLGEGRTSKSAVYNVRIKDNEVCDNVTNWSESISAAGNSAYIKVTGNQVHDNTNIGIDFNGNTGYCRKAFLDQPRNCEAANNTVYNCHCEYASCAGIYVDGAKSTKLSGNTVHHCDYGIEVGAEEKKDRYPVKNITVQDNHIHDNSKGGIWIGGYDQRMAGIVKSTKILNNTLKDNCKERDDAEIVINRCSGIVFKGNLIENTLSSNDACYIIAGEMGRKYTSNLKFIGNTYRTALSPDEARFMLFGNDISGIKAFNRLTKGSDIAEGF